MFMLLAQQSNYQWQVVIRAIAILNERMCWTVGSKEGSLLWY